MAHEYVAPRTPIEELIAGIWIELLKLPRVSVHDDFFALGGHSLLAAQVVARVRRLLSIELPLRAIFEAPTLTRLAEVVVEAKLQSLPDDVLAKMFEEVSTTGDAIR